jgi:hypothetical protein
MTNPKDLSPTDRAALLSDWRAKQRARKAEHQRLQGRIYLDTVDGDNANALEQALALHNGDDTGRVDDAERLSIVNRDVDFWSAAVAQLARLVEKDREAAAVEASRAARPEYMSRLRQLHDALAAAWAAFEAVADVGTELRAAGHMPSATILPGAPLSFLGALNPNNPASQLAAFKRMLA